MSSRDTQNPSHQRQGKEREDRPREKEKKGKAARAPDQQQQKPLMKPSVPELDWPGGRPP